MTRRVGTVIKDSGNVFGVSIDCVRWALVEGWYACLAWWVVAKDPEIMQLQACDSQVEAWAALGCC